MTNVSTKLPKVRVGPFQAMKQTLLCKNFKQVHVPLFGYVTIGAVNVQPLGKFQPSLQIPLSSFW